MNLLSTLYSPDDILVNDVMVKSLHASPKSVLYVLKDPLNFPPGLVRAAMDRLRAAKDN